MIQHFDRLNARYGKHFDIVADIGTVCLVLIAGMAITFWCLSEDWHRHVMASHIPDFLFEADSN